MNQDIKVFVISLKNSKRFHRLEKRLKKLKIKFKLINGVNGLEFYKKRKLNKISDEEKIINQIGRKMSPSEIGAAASHLKTYTYISKNKIDQAIILEDDAYLSEKICEWIKNKVKSKNNEIVSFFSYPGGIIEKKPSRTVLKNIQIHKAKTHIFNSTSYTINNFTAKKILKITKGKVIGLPDWPFNTITDGITLKITIPFMALSNDKGVSYLKKSRNEILESKLTKIKKFIPKKIFKIISIFYYLSFLPFIFRKYKNFYFYIEHFFYKSFYETINFFTGIYFNQKELYFKENYYCKDLVGTLRDVIKHKRYL